MDARILKKLTFSNFDSSNVIYMRYMFNECFSLISLDLSNFDTSELTDINKCLAFELY